MTDRRLTAANGRVADMALAGTVTADRYLEGWPMQVGVAVTDLLAAPTGSRDRQLLMGADVTVYEDLDGWSFVKAVDGYVGYVAKIDLVAPVTATHFVGTLATHSYTAEDIKSRDLQSLPFGARVTVIDERHKFFETNVGFVPKKHLREMSRPFSDPVTVAQLHFGVPYLWGGNSSRGIDCSGLVAAALSACQMPCPADSDMQCAGLGTAFSGNYQRGDLVFWKGHVGMMVDDTTMIHANAHHMACVYEPVAKAILRIQAQGDGPVVAQRRL
jgi:cell wall-associated NlpC family hydrolase